VQYVSTFRYCIRLRSSKATEINILPFVVYSCKTLSLSVRQEHKLQMFESKVLRKMHGPRDELIGRFGTLQARSCVGCIDPWRYCSNEIQGV
jgi:hypothetical protein